MDFNIKGRNSWVRREKNLSERESMEFNVKKHDNLNIYKHRIEKSSSSVRRGKAITRKTKAIEREELALCLIWIVDGEVEGKRG